MDLITEALLAARVLRPYLGRAIGSLTPVERPGLGTVAVDRQWRLYYDPEWLASLPLAQRAGVIACHEIEHLLREHHSRGGWADPTARNVAGDLEIDDDQEDGLLPGGRLRLHQLYALPEGLTLEQYLDRLPHSDTCTCSGGSGAGAPLPDELDSDDAPGLTEAEAQQVRDATAADVRSAPPGDVPAHLRIWAEARLAPPRVPWSAVLVDLVAREVGGRGDSWGRLHRRQREDLPLRPGQGERPRVAILADTSGSMGSDGSAVLSEIAAICARWPHDVWSCDVAAARVRGGRWTGGGGTDLRVGLSAVWRTRPSVTVVLTDGETPWPDRAGGRTIVALVGQGAPPPWATVVRVTP